MLRFVIHLLTLAACAQAVDWGAAIADRASWSDLGRPGEESGWLLQDILQGGDGTWWATTGAGVYWYDGYRWRATAKQEAGILRRDASGEIYLLSRDRRFLAKAGTLREVGPGKSCELNELVAVETSEWRRCRGKFGWRDGIEWTYADQPMGTSILGNMVAATPAALWWSGRSGLHRKAGSKDRLVLPLPQGERLAVLTLAENTRGDGVMTIGSPASHAGLWEWRRGGVPERVEAEGRAMAAAAVVSENGSAMVVYQSGHVRVRDGRGWQTLEAVPGFLREARRLQLGAQGEMMVMTNRRIYRYFPQGAAWITEAHPFPDGRNGVNAILLAGDGSRWLATGEGVERVGPDGRRVWIRELGGEKLMALTGVAEDRHGHVWITSGLAFGGAWRFDGRAWSHVGLREGLTDQRLHRVTRSGNGNLWFVSTGHGPGDSEEKAGAWRWDGKSFERWDRSRGLLSNRVYAAAERDGEIWIASQRVLTRAAGGKMRHWREGVELPLEPFLSALALPAGGGALVGDRRFGLFRVDAGGDMRRVTGSEGSGGEPIWDLALDGEERLWMTSSRGLLVWRAGEFGSFPEGFGLPRGQLWPVSVRGSQICVGSHGNGSACLDLAKKALPPPLVSIVDVIASEQQVQAQWRVETAWGQPNPQVVPTRTRVNGGEWTPWSVARRQVWPLRRGEHTIEVQAKNAMGELTPVSRQKVMVPGLFYRRPEFWLPLGLSLVAVLGLLALLVRRHREHSREVASREARFRALIERSSDGVILCTAEGEVAFASQSALRLLTVRSVPNAPLWDSVEEGDRAHVAAAFQAALRGEGPSSAILFQVAGPNGAGGWMQAQLTNRLHEPQVRGVVINLRDVTAEIEALRELESAKERAESASRAKSDFLATMSHEIRTPMNGILGMASLLVNSQLNPEDRESALTIRDSCRALLILLNDILDLSRIEAGKVELEQVPFDMAETVRQVGELLSPIAKEKGIVLEVDYAPEQHWFRGDGGRVRQVLLNLAGNAVKFTSEGRVDLRVTSEGGLLRCEVRDTGIGIAPDKLAGVFDKFVQADASTTRRYGGTGLGLTICRALVELMGGRISAASEPGRGSVFTVMLPLAPAEAPIAVVWDEAPAASPAAGLRVLLAEDNPVNQRVATRMLERLRCVVALAENGAEALERVTGGHYDLILMDCQMPVLDGFAASRQLRAQGYTGPIVALTANNMAGDRERCLEAGMDDFLPKPMELEQLAAVIERWSQLAVDQRP